jgi:hypothetical protein
MPEKIDTEYVLGIGGVEIPEGATFELHARSEVTFAPTHFMMTSGGASSFLILDIKIEGKSQLISSLFRGSSEISASVFATSEPVRLNFDTVLKGRVISVVVRNSSRESWYFSGAFSGPKLQGSATLYHLVKAACKDLFHSWQSKG